MNTFYLSTTVYLFSSLTSAILLMLLYVLFTCLLGKDIYWLLRIKLKRAFVGVVLGVVFIVVIERWIEQVLPALLDKM